MRAQNMSSEISHVGLCRVVALENSHGAQNLVTATFEQRNYHHQIPSFFLSLWSKWSFWQAEQNYQTDL
jgi:hypothetical protein